MAERFGLLCWQRASLFVHALLRVSIAQRCKDVVHAIHHPTYTDPASWDYEGAPANPLVDLAKDFDSRDDRSVRITAMDFTH